MQTVTPEVYIFIFKFNLCTELDQLIFNRIDLLVTFNRITVRVMTL